MISGERQKDQKVNNEDKQGVSCDTMCMRDKRVVREYLHRDVSLRMFSNRMFNVCNNWTQTYEPHFCFIILRKKESMFFSRKKLKGTVSVS